MTDGIIKGTGNSRYLKSVANVLSLYPTHESLMQALAAGTFPIDLNGINAAGWQTQGTALNKANLLTDATAALYGKNSAATPNEVLAAIKTYVDTGISNSASTLTKSAFAEYTGTGANENTITFNFAPKVVICTKDDAIVNITNGYYSLRLGISIPSTELKACGVIFGYERSNYNTSLGWYFSCSCVKSGNNFLYKWVGNNLNDSGVKYRLVAIG